MSGPGADPMHALALLAALAAPWLALALTALSRRCRGAGWLLPLAPLPALAIALLLPEGASIKVSGLIPGIIFGLDTTGRVFLLPAALLWSIAGWYALGGGDDAPGRHRGFATAWLLALAGSQALILAQDLLAFYTALALMTFAAYGLVIHQRTPSARAAGRLYLAMMIAGEVAMFTGVALLAAEGGSGGSLPFAAVAETSPPALALLGLGFATKLGVLGVHAWLPRAHPVAPVPASAVLSGVMIKAGLLGWWRVSETAVGAFPGLGMSLLLLGLAAAFYGVARGLLQHDPKIVLAWSSVSQMGLVTMLVGITQISGDAAPAAWLAVALFVVHHGLNKGALFLGAGIMKAGSPVERRLAWAILWLPALALAGAPATSGALAKAATETAAQSLRGGEWIGALLYLSTMATTLLMLRLLWCARMTRAGDSVVASGHRLAPTAILTMIAIVLPWIWFGDTAAAATALSVSGLWAATWPLTLAAAVAAVGYHGWRRRSQHAPGRWRDQVSLTIVTTLQGRAHDAMVRMAAWERQLQQWSVIGRLLVGVVLFIGAVVLHESMTG